MRRLGILGLLIAAGGCSCDPAPRCSATMACTGIAVCDLPSGSCVMPDGGGRGGGGGGGGTGGGGGAPGPCATVTCPNAWQECVVGAGDAGTCASRFVGLSWVQPSDAGPYGLAVPVPLLLRLQQRVGADGGGYPASLAYALDSAQAAQPLMRSGQTSDYGPLALQVTTLAGGNHFLDAGYAGVVASTSFIVDALSPTVEVKAQVASHPTWVNPTVWRRDEQALVLVAGNEALGTVSLSFAGSDAGVTPVAQVATCLDAGIVPTTACANGNCVCFQVDNAVPPLNALSGTFSLTVVATDLVGNPASGITPLAVAVTRQRWVVGLSAGAGYPKGGPGVGSDGTVYVGTSTGITALSPDGVIKWDAGVGTVEGSVAVGATDAGVEYIFFGANKAGIGYLQPLDISGQLQGPACGNAGSAANASPALSRTSYGLAATATLSFSGTAKLASTGIAGGCLILGTVATTALDMDPGVNVVMKGNTVWIPSSDANIRAFTAAAFTWNAATPDQGYPISLAATAAPFLGLAMRNGGMTVAGGGPGIGQAFEFSVLAPDAGTTWRQPLMTTAAAGTPAVGSNGLFHGFNLLPLPELRRVPFDGGTPFALALGAAAFVQSSPLVGAGDAGNLVYWVTKPGALYVTDESLAMKWTTSALVTGPVVASPSLDCNRTRAGGPGVLYIASTDGNLYSVLVDSPKLASTDWPKWQHDAQNSGNPDFPLNAGCP